MLIIILNHFLIKEYSDDFELVIVEIKVSGKEIRIISGYGPQENLPEAERMQFFLALEEEIVKSKSLGKSVLIEVDANSKLGKNIICGDPYIQSANGRILADIIDRHEMIVVNSLEKCQGSITRERVTTNSVEKSSFYGR